VKYKVLGKEFPTLAMAIHYLEVGIRLEKDPIKKERYMRLLKGLKE
jgi:hypothetical protein